MLPRSYTSNISFRNTITGQVITSRISLISITIVVGFIYRNIFYFNCLFCIFCLGAGQFCESDPAVDCYSTDPRSRIFRERQENVTNMETFMNLMQYNNFHYDPLSLGDPCNVSSLNCYVMTIQSNFYTLNRP